MRAHVAICLLAAAAAGCPAPRPTPAPPTPVDPAPRAIAPPAATAPPLGPPPAGLRLPASARPVSYQLALELDPAQAAFSGRVVIDLELEEAAHPLWLNADHLTIDGASLHATANAPARTLRVVPGPDGVIGLAADVPIGPGRVTVELAYRGAAEPGAPGIDRHEERGAWYVDTWLQPQGARRVVPCFDEPGWKVPWQLELTTPAGLFAAANAPLAHEEVLPDGRRRVRFAPTAPIPSYLFAFIVGPYEVVDAGTTRGGAPMRIIVPHGKTADAAFMAARSGALVAAMEDYTGIPFAYPKLDHVVSPGTPAGAMENVGLVLYAPQFLLIPDGESDEVRRTALDVMAHEVAHHWFGNLVTPAWWDDVWLNEAFATWAADRLLAAHHAAIGGALNPARSRRSALEAEADPLVRAIRQPIVEKVDIDRAFDDITYSKGATVLYMFEHALGPEVFRAGLRAYLGAHRDGNATAAHFIAAVAAASRPEVAAALTTWIDRPGAPVVSMALACPRGGPAAVELTQHRYRVADGTAAPDATVWHVPVCVRVPGEPAPRCTTLTERAGRIALGDRCPKLVVPTGRGHYRAALSPALRAAVLAAWPRLDGVEQAAFVGDTGALVDADELEPAALLDLLPRLGASDNPLVVVLGLAAIAELDAVVVAADRPAFQKLARRAFGKAARRIGWTPRPREPLVAAAARPRLLPLAVGIGGDAALGREALALARRWLDDHTTLSPALWAPVLRTATRLDDAALFERMLAQVLLEPDVAARRALTQALGRTHDPVRLQRVLETVAAQPAIPPELVSALVGPDLPATTAVRLAFWRAHAGALLAKLPPTWRQYLAPSTCLAAHRDEAVALIDAHFAPMPDYGVSARDRDVARMDACIQRRARQAQPLAAYFARHR